MFSPHVQLLVRVSRDPESRVRDLAQAMSMTERNIQNLMRDLERAGLVEIERHGRRNRYRIQTRRRLGRELGLSMPVHRLLQFVEPVTTARDAKPQPRAKLSRSQPDPNRGVAAATPPSWEPTAHPPTADAAARHPGCQGAPGQRPETAPVRNANRPDADSMEQRQLDLLGDL